MTDTPPIFCNTCGRGESFFPSCREGVCPQRSAVEAPVPVEVVVNLDLPMVVGMRLGSAFLGALKALEGVPDLEARTEAALRLTGLVAASPTLLGLLTEGSE